MDAHQLILRRIDDDARQAIDFPARDRRGTSATFLRTLVRSPEMPAS